MSARTSSLGLRSKPPPYLSVVYVFAFSMMKAPNATDHYAVQEFGVLNRTVDHGLVDTVMLFIGTYTVL